MNPIGTTMIMQGDARHLPLPDASVDAILTDPPYGLEFMGKDWDAPWRTGDGFRRSRNTADAGRDDPFGRASRTSPEYIAGRGFQEWCEQWAAEALRVLKPGGHLLAFGGTRTWHRLTCAIEDAGFEIRDSMAWLYGSGFPKSLDVGKAVDQSRGASTSEAAAVVRRWLNERRLEAGKSLAEVNQALGYATNGGGLASSWMTNPTSKAIPDAEQWAALKSVLGFGDDMDDELSRLWVIRDGADRPVVGVGRDVGNRVVTILHSPVSGEYPITAAATDMAQQWSGWGTALKPGFEPIVVARKPLAGTVAANVLTYGTGALNIDACRTPAGQDYAEKCASVVGLASNRNGAAYGEWTGVRVDSSNEAGRWPTNVLLDSETAAEVDRQTGTSRSRAYGPRSGAAGEGWRLTATGAEYDDEGGASRFFPTFRYAAKAPTSERPVVDGVAHPTVKPLDLMRWLCRLVAQPGGLILDPFAGSGTTLEAGMLEGFRVVGVERDASYLPLIRHRIDRATRRAQPGVSRLAGVKPRLQATDQDTLFDLDGDAA